MTSSLIDIRPVTGLCVNGGAETAIGRHRLGHLAAGNLEDGLLRFSEMKLG